MSFFSSSFLARQQIYVFPKTSNDSFNQNQVGPNNFQDSLLPKNAWQDDTLKTLWVERFDLGSWSDLYMVTDTQPNSFVIILVYGWHAGLNMDIDTKQKNKKTLILIPVTHTHPSMHKCLDSTWIMKRHQYATISPHPFFCQCYRSHVYFSSAWGHCFHVGICVSPSVDTSIHPLLSCRVWVHVWSSRGHTVVLL